MTRDEILEGVERLKPWFHKIDLGEGVTTKDASVSGEPADHPLTTWAVVSRCLPEDLAGKSVLDVGCNAGFYAVEASRRGAARVLGVDAQRHQIRQALFVRRALGLPLEFRRMSVYDLDTVSPGRFDVVLALGLVYHCKHLVLALERLYDVTGELLILETAILKTRRAAIKRPSQRDDADVAVTVHDDRYRTGEITRKLHPLAYFENSPDSKEAVFNWFLPSPEAMVALLQNVGFDGASVFEVTGDRAVVVARKTQSARGAVLQSLASRLRLESGPAVAPVDVPLVFQVRVENVGSETWRAAVPEGDGRGMIRLGAHLLMGEEEVEWSWGRAALPRDLAPGETDVVLLTAYAPLTPGSYTVELDAVAEQISWFEDLGSELLTHALEVQPVPPPVPWYRSLGLAEGLRVEPAEPFATVAAYLAAVDAAAAATGSLSAERTVDAVTLWILGWAIDPATRAEHVREIAGKGGVSLLVRRLLAAPEARPVPPALADPRREALCQRVAVERIREVLEPGESFSGEAAIARAILREGRAASDAAFVQLAYAKILDRPADPEGERNATARLEARTLTRTALVRDLLWSDELRG